MENSTELRTEDGQYFEIPEGGSLGLLALGYVGVMLWREKRKEAVVKRKGISKISESIR